MRLRKQKLNVKLSGANEPVHTKHQTNECCFVMLTNEVLNDESSNELIEINILHIFIFCLEIVTQLIFKNYLHISNHISVITYQSRQLLVADPRFHLLAVEFGLATILYHHHHAFEELCGTKQ